MSATENQFRGVAFGGFNRQDVLTYVETTSAAHIQQMELLKKALKAAEETCEEQAAMLAEAETRETHYTEENSRLSAELDVAQSELSKNTVALSAAERELVILREKVKRLEPSAEAFIRIKDRTASVEFEAHLRAQNVLDAAETRAKEFHAQVEEWLYKVQVGYDRLRTDVDATIFHTSGELGRVQTSLNSITADFSAHDDVLKNILECYQQDMLNKTSEAVSVENGKDMPIQAR